MAVVARSTYFRVSIFLPFTKRVDVDVFLMPDDDGNPLKLIDMLVCVDRPGPAPNPPPNMSTPPKPPKNGSCMPKGAIR